MRSTALVDPFDGLICVGSFWLRRHRSFLLISSSIFFPFGLVCLHPQRVLWLLKSPRRMKGFVSCLVRFLSSFSFIGLFGGRYIEHIVMVLCRVTCVAIA